MVEEKLINTVQSTFSFYGLIIDRKLSVSLAKQLAQQSEDERENWLTDIVTKVLSQNLTTPHVSIDHLKAAVQECVRPDVMTDTEKVLTVINAFDVPKIRHDLNKKKFVVESVPLDLYTEVRHKSLLLKHRFELLWYRTLRHEVFSPPKFGETKEDKMELTPIEYLLSETKTKNVCVIGLLTKLTQTQFHLEDPGGNIKIDLKNANFQDKLMVDGSIVIATGSYKRGVLEVEDIGFPPAELVDVSRANFGDENTFGGPSRKLPKLSEKLRSHEQANPEEMIVFLSDLWLDNSTVLEKFKIILQGYSEYPPVAFVICGHFLSSPSSVRSARQMKEGFKVLADIVQRFPEIRNNSTFILVPGMYDPGSPKILPRPPLPKHIVADFAKSVPKTIVATNPCRIQYCTKEIVVLREDVLTKMCRNTICFPSEAETRTKKIHDYFAKSIICQSHLVPFNLSVVPVYWRHDHGLQIYPTPDLIVVADEFEAYSTTYTNCTVMNPGIFPRNKYSFKVYLPATNTIEDCGIPPELETEFA